VILLVNQHTVPIFIDIVNAFAETGEETVLFSGYIETGAKPLSKKVKVVDSVRYQRHSVPKRMFTWLVFSAHYFFYLLFTKRPLQVLVVTNPPLAPLISGLMMRWKKVPYFVLIYDLYPEAFVQAGFLNNAHVIYRSWQKVNRQVFKSANGIFTLSESMKNAVSFYVDDPNKITVIHNWADLDYIRPIPRAENSFIKQNKIEGKFIVMYAGNMGLTHDLESVMDAAESLQEIPNLVFVFIGEGGKRSRLQQFASDKKLNNVLFLPYQSSADFPMAMAAAHVGIVTLGLGAEGISVPSKTYLILAAGSCILAIAPATSELSRLVAEHRAGIVCEPGNPSALAIEIRKLKESTSALETYKLNALKAAQNYTPQNAKHYIRAVKNASN
jgi:glycosyltransferase involved in cell wall biosynthesis